MEKFIEFPTADGRSVLVQVSANSGGPVTRGGHGSAVFERAQRTFEDAVGQIQPAVQAVIDQLVSLTRRPSEVSVEFGLVLHAEAGAVIAQTGANANFTVKLTWQDTIAPDRAPEAHSP